MVDLQRLIRIGLRLAFNPARLAEDAADAARRSAVLAICVLLAGIILLLAAGCAAAGLWIFVQGRLGPVWAAFITAAAFLILAAIVLLIGIAASRRRKPAEGRQPDLARQAVEVAAALAALPAAALAAVPPPGQMASASRSFFARHKGTALLAAIVVGLVVGQDLLRPGSRRKKSRD